MDTIKTKIDVMNHYINGGEIEWMLKDDPQAVWSVWESSCGNPTWNWAKCDYRIKKTSKFRLPTKKEFENLISHFSRWNDKRNGLEIENDNHEILFLPSKGYYYDSLYQENELDIKNKGNYWSSTTIDDYKYYAYALDFDPIRKNTDNCCINVRCSVRLVSDIPFEGAIEFEHIYWKPENESGYFTYEEALEKFNNK